MIPSICGNLINGEWILKGDVSESRNPCNVSEVIGKFHKATNEDVETALDAAQASLDGWAQSGLEQRKAILDFIGDELIERCDEIGAILAREEGKPFAEGRGETYRSGQFFQYYAAECLRQMGESTPSTRPGVDVVVTREPVGVVAIITPWNFPIAVGAWKIAPALAYGNAIVLKPAEVTSISAWILADIINRSGLPAGVFNMVMGSGRVIGETLSSSPKIDAISFTGSVPVGRGIARNAVENMARVQLEMGSKNALVVLNDADLDIAVNCAVSGAFFGTGQKCTASSRLIVEEGIHDEFVKRLITATEALVVGDSMDPKTQIGSVVSERQLSQNLSYIQKGIDEGATLAIGGQKLDLGNDGYFMSPAVFVDTTSDMTINREEIFGPITAVIKVKDYDEALAVSNDTEFGLTSGIVTNSLRNSIHFQKNSKSGCVMVNLATAGTDYHVPFGGRKSSSYGPREQGTYAKEFYTIVKTSYISAGK